MFDMTLTKISFLQFKESRIFSEKNAVGISFLKV